MLYFRVYIKTLFHLFHLFHLPSAVRKDCIELHTENRYNNIIGDVAWMGYVFLFCMNRRRDAWRIVPYGTLIPC